MANREPEIVTAFRNVPYNVIANDLLEGNRTEYFQEMQELNDLYDAYKKGVDFYTEGSNAQYMPSQLRYKKAASIINKEARFFFANPPTFSINADNVEGDDAINNTAMQTYLNNVLQTNNMNDRLLKACKDCFIARRIAIMLNFNEEEGVTITFFNALEFIYEMSGHGGGELQKLVTFYNMVDTTRKSDQRWFKKTYTLENGVVFVEEVIYDGLGKPQETVTSRRKTLFPYIPAVVILNDGLTGETRGESEMERLIGYEATYSKMANADIDAKRKGMNPIRYAVDASSGSTTGLSIAPGSFWDIQTDENKVDTKSATVGILEASMSYSAALDSTLDRIENTMYGELDVPNVTSEKLQGVITSGKTLKALYWGLTVRCDEKMLTWEAALRHIVKAIIDGGKLYPFVVKKYDVLELPDVEYDILVENNYSLPEDEAEEKNLDMSEVQANTMSKMSYLKKWRELTDDEAWAELEQIKKEIDLFENSQMMPGEEGMMAGGEEGMEDDIDMELGEEEEDTEIEDQFDELEALLDEEE